MTLVSLIDCCHLLSIDLKTLHRWMMLSRLSAESHPFDARLKCLTSAQIQQLALTHRRLLPDLQQLHSQPEVSPPASTVEMSASSGLDLQPDLSRHVTELTKQLSTLQTQVTMFQHQLTLLTEQLQKEQEWRISQARAFQEKSQESSLDNSRESSRKKSQESSLEKSQESSRKKSQESSLEKSQESSLDNSRESSQESARTSANAPRRKRSHVLPLVEYGGTEGKYVVISPQQGLLEFSPDSPEWFAWLSTLSSFRFVGSSGHLTVHRTKCSPHWSWRATRSIRSRSCSLHLVRTEGLTTVALLS